MAMFLRFILLLFLSPSMNSCPQRRSRARLLTRDLVQQADIVLTMARHHRARVHELGGEGRTHVLGEYSGRTGPEAEVSDPFGGDLELYRETYQELETLIRAAVERLVSQLRDSGRRD